MASCTLSETDRILIAELAQSAQTGDRGAFGELFQQFERQVFAIALRRLGNYCEAQEVCQDVFVQAMLKLEQLRDPAAFGPWIRSIAHRMAINRALRRGPDMAAVPAILDAMETDHATPLNNLLAGERCDQLRDGLARLGDLDRRTLEAFYVEGRSLKQMSGDFQAPLGTIKRRLHIARKRLAKEVEPLTAL